MRLPLFYLLGLLGLCACRNDKLDPPVEDRCEDTSYTYQSHAREILERRCATSGCHNGVVSPNVLNYSSLAGSIASGRFAREVFEQRSMPVGAPLSAQDFEILQCWVNKGYPE